jgi:hypothetical protein
MKKVLAVLVIALLSTTGRADTPASAAGVYRGSSGIESRTITLLTNGNYLARWNGDMGSNGSATGTWELAGGEVRLTPKREEGLLMPGHFRVLLLRSFEGRQALLRKEDVKNADNEFFHLFLQKKKPNQPSEPTVSGSA